MTNAPLPGKATNKAYEMQGWNAAKAGFKVSECPYYPTSTAEKYWLKGLQRTRFIAVETVRRILPIALRAAGLTKKASNCEAVKPMDVKNDAAADADADATAAARREVWVTATAILDEALKIGKQADHLDGALIVRRMAAAKELAAS